MGDPAALIVAQVARNLDSEAADLEQLGRPNSAARLKSWAHQLRAAISRESGDD